MHFATLALVAALSASNVVAGPTHNHAHMHRHKHQKKDADVDWEALNWSAMGINWSSAYEAGLSTSSPTPTPTPSPAVHAQIVTSATAAAAATTSATSNILDNIGNDIASLFEGIVGLANDFTEFGQATSGSGSDVGAIGNIGSPQCSNMIKVASAAGHQYTNNFINTSGESMTVFLWNKAFNAGSGVEANLGSAVAPKTPCMTIALAPGQNQVVAFQENTQIGACQATTSVAASGAFATTWLEANFASSGVGFDLSAIMNPSGNNYNMAISSTQNSCVSDQTQNYWYAVNNNPEDPVPFGSSDGSCYIPGGQGATLTTKMGGSS